MFNIKCKCGKSNKNFKNNIGNFYIDTCCLIAGYDYLGNPPPKKEEEEKPKRAYRPSGKYSGKPILSKDDES